MDKGMKNMEMETVIRVSISTINQMVTGFISGQMVKHMTVAGYRGAKMAMVSGKDQTVTGTWENGKIIKLGDMEFINGLMETNTRVTGEQVSNMDKEQTTLLIKMFTLANIKTENQMAMANINGEKVRYMQDNS